MASPPPSICPLPGMAGANSRLRRVSVVRQPSRRNGRSAKSLKRQGARAAASVTLSVDTFHKRRTPLGGNPSLLEKAQTPSHGQTIFQGSQQVAMECQQTKGAGWWSKSGGTHGPQRHSMPRTEMRTTCRLVSCSFLRPHPLLAHITLQKRFGVARPPRASSFQL